MEKQKVFHPTRVIIDRESGAAVHPNGLRGYISEMDAQATRRWQGIRKLVPDLPALDMSPVDLAKEIVKQHPRLEVKVITTIEGKQGKNYPGCVRLKQQGIIS
jgi:hypothetical protein